MTARADAALRVLLCTTPGGLGSRINAKRITEFIAGGNAPTYRKRKVLAVSEDGIRITFLHGSMPVQYRRTQTKMRRVEG